MLPVLTQHDSCHDFYGKVSQALTQTFVQESAYLKEPNIN